MTRPHVILIGLLLVLALFVWLRGSASDADKIRTLAHTIAEACSKKGSDTAITAASRASTVTRHFTEALHFEPGVQIGTLTRKRQLHGALTQLFMQSQRVQVDVIGMDEPELLGSNEAVVQITLQGDGTRQGRGTGRQMMELTIGLEKEDGDWKINSLKPRR